MNVAVVRGEPDEVELAALVAGLAAGLSPVAAPAPVEQTDVPDGAGSRWRRASRPGPVPTAPGPDAWKWSLR